MWEIAKFINVLLKKIDYKIVMKESQSKQIYWGRLTLAESGESYDKLYFLSCGVHGSISLID